MLKILSLFVGMSLAMGFAPSAEASSLSLSQWKPEKGDMFVVDIQENVGYLMHPDGRYLVDVVGSGGDGVANYGKFGRIYTKTPHGIWRVKSTTIQSDRGIFGPTGLFLRLHAKNDPKGSPLGMHSVGNINTLLASVDRYWSMGCILVRDDLLDLLEEEYELHKDIGGFLVVTLDGFDIQRPTSTLAQAD